MFSYVVLVFFSFVFLSSERSNRTVWNAILNFLWIVFCDFDRKPVTEIQPVHRSIRIPLGGGIPPFGWRPTQASLSRLPHQTLSLPPREFCIQWLVYTRCKGLASGFNLRWLWRTGAPWRPAEASKELHHSSTHLPLSPAPFSFQALFSRPFLNKPPSSI